MNFRLDEKHNIVQIIKPDGSVDYAYSEIMAELLLYEILQELKKLSDTVKKPS